MFFLLFFVVVGLESMNSQMLCHKATYKLSSNDLSFYFHCVYLCSYICLCMTELCMCLNWYVDTKVQPQVSSLAFYLIYRENVSQQPQSSQ